MLRALNWVFLAALVELESDAKELSLFLDLGNGGDEQRDGLFLGAVDMVIVAFNPQI